MLPFTAVAQAPAQAGSPGQTRAVLEEIVVTAQRREESLQDVAISVSAVTGSDLERQGITNFQDIDRMVPGLYAVSDEGFSSGSLRIRGVGSRGQSSVDPSVGVVVDGVFQPRVGSVFSDLMDIERIEVLRGPQGTLFGKNTTAGVINIVTQRPDTREFSGMLRGTAGNYNNTDLRGTVNIPMVEDRMALRVSAYSVQRDGFNKNRVRGVDTRDESRQGGRARLLIAPTDNLDINLIVESTDRRSTGDRDLARYGTYDGQPPAGGQPLENLAAGQGVTLPGVRRFSGNVFEDGWNRNRDMIDRGTLLIDWAIPGHTISSISAYEKLDGRMQQDSDGTPLDLQQLDITAVQKTTTQELRLASDRPLAGLVDYVAGLYYQRDKIDSDVISLDGADAAAIEGRAQRPPTAITSTIDTTNYAIFGNATFHLAESWRASIGLRYTEAEKEQTQVIQGLGALIPLSEKKFRATTYTAQLIYDFSENGMVYLATGSGFKTGGFNRESPICIFNPLACLQPDQQAFDKEETTNYELGWKTQWLDNSVRFNGTLFYQTYDDFQVTTSIPSTANIIVTNAADVESYGLEMDIAATPTSNILLNASAAYIITEYDSYSNAQCPTVVTKNPACTQDLSGERLDNAPKWTGNIGAEYFSLLPDSGDLEWFARVDASFRSSANLLSTLDPDTRQGSYTLLGARTGFRHRDGDWKIEFWSNNLADKDYAVVAHRPALHSDGLSLIRGMPRTWGITTEVRF